MAHKCHATGCEVEVKPELFMCKKHWYSLPLAMRNAIWANYRKGQEVSKDPSGAYIQVAQDAILYLETKEGTKS